jgi:hypothetical protein
LSSPSGKELSIWEFFSRGLEKLDKERKKLDKERKKANQRVLISMPSWWLLKFSCAATGTSMKVVGRV